MLHRCRPNLDIDNFIENISTLNDSNEGYVQEFENMFSKYLHAPFCIATNEGRAAILLAMNIVNVKDTDEIIIQSLTCRTAIDPILQTGATISLTDIDQEYTIPIENVKKRINKKTKVIIATHLYGIPSNIEDLTELAREKNLILVEDCAQCLGATYKNKKIGSFGDLSIFSFNMDKPISLGDGGMVIINNENFIEEALNIKASWGKTSLKKEKNSLYSLLAYNILTKKEYYNRWLSVYFGKELINNNKKIVQIIDKSIKQNCTAKELETIIMNFVKDPVKRYTGLIEKIHDFEDSRTIEKINTKQGLMNEYRAKIGINQLKTYNNLVETRNNNAQIYEKLLKNNENYVTPKIDSDTKPAFLRYTILNKTDHAVPQISKIAQNKGYEVGSYNWSKSIHMIPLYNKIIQHNQEKLENSEYIANHLINLPVHSYTNADDIVEIVDILNNFSNKQSTSPRPEN